MTKYNLFIERIIDIDKNIVKKITQQFTDLILNLNYDDLINIQNIDNYNDIIIDLYTQLSYNISQENIIKLHNSVIYNNDTNQNNETYKYHPTSIKTLNNIIKTLRESNSDIIINIKIKRCVHIAIYFTNIVKIYVNILLLLNPKYIGVDKTTGNEVVMDLNAYYNITDDVELKNIMLSHFDMCNNDVMYTNVCNNTNINCVYKMNNLFNNKHTKINKKEKQPKKLKINLNPHIGVIRNTMNKLFLKKIENYNTQDSTDNIQNSTKKLMDIYNENISVDGELIKKYINHYSNENKNIIKQMNIISIKLIKIIFSIFNVKSDNILILKKRISGDNIYKCIEQINELKNKITYNCTSIDTSNTQIITTLNEIQEKNKLIREIINLSEERDALLII
jgi:hypothetical protein